MGRRSPLSICLSVCLFSTFATLRAAVGERIHTTMPSTPGGEGTATEPGVQHFTCHSYSFLFKVQLIFFMTEVT